MKVLNSGRVTMGSAGAGILKKLLGKSTHTPSGHQSHLDSSVKTSPSSIMLACLVQMQHFCHHGDTVCPIQTQVS